ncbi:MAG: hypothetical protein FD143_3656 [Ignavibacteria bacterium]|nr:MAG: hypothetical protein FD143_3656 [Ignavibacteria bacterium]
MAKNAVFSPILQRNFKTMRSIFARLDEKHNCLGNFEKFSKICKKFPKKMAKNAVFSPILQKKRKPCVQILRVWTKNTIVWEIYINI